MKRLCNSKLVELSGGQQSRSQVAGLMCGIGSGVTILVAASGAGLPLAAGMGVAMGLVCGTGIAAAWND